MSSCRCTGRRWTSPRLFDEPRIGSTTEGIGLCVRYLTPHSKWSIHSEYQDNLFMLSLSRGGPTMWMSPQDATKIGVADNDWVEAVNRNGVMVLRLIVSHRMPEGTVFVHHAQERTIDVPLSRDHRQPRRHPQLADPAAGQTHPSGRRVRADVLRLQLSRADRQSARRGHHGPPALPGGAVLMRVMAQLAMVMNLDKCIGCHTCSVTCKQAWTNRPGVEYVWFNNVETRPGQGYPRTYEDQERWEGGWVRDKRGPAAAAGRRPDQEADDDLLQPEDAVDRRLLRAVDLRLREPDQRPAG